jgi:hypothetical protein
MKKQMINAGLLAVLLGASGFILGCNKQNSDDTKQGANGRILETVEWTKSKTLTPDDQAKISATAVEVLSHVSQAKKEIEAKKVDAAKKELKQADTLLDSVKKMLPRVRVVDHIWDTKMDLIHADSAEAQPDLVAIISSIDQLYDVLPEGNAKEHAKVAKTALTEGKKKGIPKAKDELDAVVESLDFREVDMSVSYTSRLIKATQTDLEKGKPEEASEELTAVTDGLLTYDTAVVDQMDVAAGRIWIAKQDYAAKEYKAAKDNLAKAKTALREGAQSGDNNQK